MRGNLRYLLEEAVVKFENDLLGVDLEVGGM